MADPQPRPKLPTWVQGILSPDSPFRTPDAPPPPESLTPPRQAAQPTLAPGESHSPPPQEPDYGYGFRYNSNQPKGLGYLGTLKRPDATGVMGEYSIDEGQGEIPSMVPTLTREEIDQILASHEGDPLAPAIRQKATAFAEQRRAAGLPVFARAGEQDPTRYPDIPRDAPVARPQAPPMAASHVRRLLPDPRLATTQLPTPPAALQPPQQAAQPPLAALRKAETIGPPGLGDHYSLAGLHELLASDNPARLLAGYVVGPGRPSSVAAADPYGIVAAEQGKGPMPIMVGATAELPQAQALVQGASKKSLARLAERFPAFATDFAKHTTGETLPPALGHLADVLIQTEQPGVYALKPEVQARIAHFLEEGKSVTRQANWRGSTSREILKAFDNDPELADIWARMVGATSPSTEVPRNTKEAVQGMRRYLMTGGKPFTEETLTQLPGGRFGVPASKFGNMNRAQLQEALSGDKVDAFAQLMRDHDRIPLDRHAIYALGGVLPEEGEAELARHLKPLREFFGLLEGRPPKYKVNGDMYGTLNKREAYERVEQALADTLRTLDPDRPLKDVFAQMWEGTRMQRGGEFQGGPIDLMGPRGLLQRGAMTDPKQMLKALRMNPGKNWLPKLAALAALGGADAARTGAPPADAAQASPGYSDRRGPLGPLAPPPTTRR